MIHTNTLVKLRESEKSVSCDNQHTASQGLSVSDSLLPPSEPPEINNWFSSYEYESLVLETNDDFGFSEHQEYGNECSSSYPVNAIERSSELVASGKDDGMMKKKKSRVLTECNHTVKGEKCQNHVLDSLDSPSLSPVESEPLGIENWFSSYAYESPTTDTMDDIFLSDHKECMDVWNDKYLKLHQKESEKDENLSCVPSDDLNCNQTLEQSDKGSAEYVKNQTELLNESANANASENVNQISSEANSLEAKGDENGFVSIKSKREKDDKSLCGNQKRVPSCAGKMKKGDESARRKILGDVTNIDERSGKWKCPRKRKPDVGPPLKQLRLGQWFHHV